MDSIPTVEQIRQRLKDPDFQFSTPVEQKVRDLEKKVVALRAGKGMSTAELREGLHALFGKYNFNPVEELILLSQGTNDEGLSAKINIFLSELLVPKLKSVEVSGTIDHNHVVVIRRYGNDGSQRDEPMKSLASRDGPARENPVARTGHLIDAEVLR